MITRRGFFSAVAAAALLAKPTPAKLTADRIAKLQQFLTMTAKSGYIDVSKLKLHVIKGYWRDRATWPQPAWPPTSSASER